ncbi:tRNA-binding protein [Sphingobacterium rhinopitheci]|uniref:tRNA-binding protein n=1 Tax=Sphingobacterium rhinopitheci TaxID=2781960 RepID=UPI001F5234A6|nr:tRNA-binding protein [Sphingobacterium rhinopitheci]MCI0921101.1 tRNA-binding protein [Sphingobacterium rhinopitheci]
MEISWRDFEKVDLRVGTIVEAKDFPAARKPAYQLLVDFGDTIGLRKSSAQITALYKQEDLIGRQVIAVINFPKKQIGKFMSECLVTGVADEGGNIVLATVERKVPNGTKLI